MELPVGRIRSPERMSTVSLLQRRPMSDADSKNAVGLVVRVLVPLTAVVVLWLLLYAAIGHAGTVLALIVFLSLILIPNRLHRPNDSGP